MTKTKFAIGFVGRVGSSYLQGLLDSHPDARCDGELCGPSGLVERSGLDTEVYFSQQKWNNFNAWGFKLGLFHIQQKPELPELLAHLNFKAIILTRENLLDQYISMRLAQINNAWTSSMGKYKASSFVTTAEEASQAMQAHDNGNHELADALVMFPNIHVTYERLHERGTRKQILDFLGLKKFELNSHRFKKQRKGSQRDAIENYDEIKSALSSSKFAVFFEK